MTPERTKEAFDLCRAVLDKEFHEWDPVELTEGMKKVKGAGWHPSYIGHLKFMCETGKQFVDEGRIEKAMRWLGFLQGAIWVGGLASIEEMKHWNMPKEESTSAPSASVPAPSTGSLQDLEDRIRARFSAEDLDDYVIEFKAKEAADINNAGVDAQLDYLGENVDDEWWEELLAEEEPEGLPRCPDGTINNCALANGHQESECQMCGGRCPDRGRFK